jgi:hypothetical protein
MHKQLLYWAGDVTYINMYTSLTEGRVYQSCWREGIIVLLQVKNYYERTKLFVRVKLSIIAFKIIMYGQNCETEVL